MNSLTEEMGEALEAYRVREGPDTDSHWCSALQEEKTNIPITDDIKRDGIEKREQIEENYMTLSVSGSLMRRTSREFVSTILRYSLLSVRGFTISTSSLPTAIRFSDSEIQLKILIEREGEDKCFVVWATPVVSSDDYKRVVWVQVFKSCPMSK